MCTRRCLRLLDRRAGSCRRPGTPTSAACTPPRRACASDGTATHRASGAANATVCVTSGGALTRLRTSGAATPAATTPQAVALIALDSRTEPEYRSRRRHPRSRLRTRLPPAARALPARVQPCAPTSPRRRTSAPITVLAMSASGCHCTPSTKRLSGSSIASGRSSSVERPLTTSPSPSRSMP